MRRSHSDAAWATHGDGVNGIVSQSIDRYVSVCSWELDGR